MTEAVLTAARQPLQRRLDVTSAEAQARLRKRYRAEARFRAYGLAAILFAAVFLCVLLGDILYRAIPAFTQSRLNLEVAVAADKVDPKAPRLGDYDPIVREGLRALFPNVTTRGDRRTLDSILSSGAADILRERVAADPALVGQRVKVPILLSSDADLYLKGITTEQRVDVGAERIAPSAATGAVTITSAPGAFADELALIKTVLAEYGQSLRDGIGQLELTLGSVSADLKAAEVALASARAVNDGPKIGILEAEVAKHTGSKQSLEAKIAEDRATADALFASYRDPKAPETLTSRMPSLLIDLNQGVVKATKVSADGLEGEVLVPLASTDAAEAGAWRKLLIQTPEDSRKIPDKEVAYLERLETMGAVSRVPNLAFFTSGDSREPELAGILGALAGSAFTMLVTLALCLPIGVLAAIYLEEFAPKNRLTGLIEVNINNLAAVPSIVFGLLGLAVFLNFFGMPRSAPLVGGLVLALLVLPTIIIASRAALKAVPPSIREAALGIGASKQQAVFHHVLPLAMPGVLTGTIIGMAHALGETAPLLMIGMIAFIVDVPGRVTDAATVLPVQIFLWSDLPEVGFKAKTAAAIIVLLLFLFVMNGLAIWLRKKFERRW